MFERAHEDLSVADLAGARGSKNSFNHGVNRVVSDGDVDADFGKKVDDIFRAAVELRMAALTAEALDFRNSEAVNAGGECASATETGVISRALFFRHVFAAAYKRSIYFQQYSNS